MNNISKILAGILFASLLLSACAAVPEALPQPTATPIMAGETPMPNDAPLMPPKAALAAQQMLAERLNIAVEDVTIAAIVEMNWPDSCLGLGGAAESCLAATVPGFKVVLNAGGQDYEFRTDREGGVVRAVEHQTSDMDAPAAGETVRKLLARRLGVDVAEIELVNVERVDWQDSCLGYGSPVELCAQVITPGYRVIVKTAGTSYEFHTDLEVLRIRNQGGYEEYTGLPPAARDEIARQVGVEPAKLVITSVERVDWSDSCLDVLPPNRVCITAITPGWRVLVEVNGAPLEFRSDMSGITVIQYPGESSAEGGTAVLFWQIEGETCREARFGGGVVRYGTCNSDDLQEAKLSDERAQELEFLAATYHAFQAHTPSGTVSFGGRGSQMPTLAQQRAIAEWAWLVRNTSAATASAAPLLTWARQGGIAGFCDALTVDTAGFIHASNCRQQPAAKYTPRQITSEQLETAYDWMETYAAFEMDQKDPPVPDAMQVKLSFAGRGRLKSTEALLTLVQAFAVEIYSDALKAAQ